MERNGAGNGLEGNAGHEHSAVSQEEVSAAPNALRRKDFRTFPGALGPMQPGLQRTTRFVNDLQCLAIRDTDAVCLYAAQLGPGGQPADRHNNCMDAERQEVSPEAPLFVPRRARPFLCAHMQAFANT